MVTWGRFKSHHRNSAGLYNSICSERGVIRKTEAKTMQPSPTAGKLMGRGRERAGSDGFVPPQFRATALQHERTKAAATAVHFSALALTPTDIPRSGGPVASLLTEPYPGICRMWSVAHGPFRAAVLFGCGSNSPSPIQVRMTCWRSDKMGRNAQIRSGDWDF